MVTIGRLTVAYADAAPLTSPTRVLRADRMASDAASRHEGNRQLIGSPNSESTRSDEIPATPGGPFSSNASSAEASGPASPAFARTAAPSALSSANSAYRSESDRKTGRKKSASLMIRAYARRSGSRTRR